MFKNKASKSGCSKKNLDHRFLETLQMVFIVLKKFFYNCKIFFLTNLILLMLN